MRLLDVIVEPTLAPGQDVFLVLLPEEQWDQEGGGSATLTTLP